MWNIWIREMFICIGIRKTPRTFFVRIRNFYYLLDFYVFNARRERDTIFTMLTVPSDPTTRCASRRPNWTRLGSDPNSLRPPFKSQLTAFFQKSPKIFSPSLPGKTSFTSPIPFPIQGFYYDICDCHIIPATSVNTCAQCVPLPVN